MTDRAPLFASEAPPRAKITNYPDPFAARVGGRLKRPLGDLFGLRNFGVNLTRLAPGAVSSLHHRHSRQDEFIYVVEGEATLFTDRGQTTLRPGMVAGFPANGTAHHLENNSERDCVIIEIGDRSDGDMVSYPVRRPASRHGKRRPLAVRAQGRHALLGNARLSPRRS